MSTIDGSFSLNVRGSQSTGSQNEKFVRALTAFNAIFLHVLIYFTFGAGNEKPQIESV